MNNINEIKEKILEFFNDGSHHNELLDLIQGSSPISILYELIIDSRDAIKIFGYSSIITKVKKQICANEELFWINEKCIIIFNTQEKTMPLFYKMFAHITINCLLRSPTPSLLDVLRGLKYDSEINTKKNLDLISEIFYIISDKDLFHTLLVHISTTMSRESYELISYLLEIAQKTNDLSNQRIILKAIYCIYEYSNISSLTAIPSLGDYVLEAIKHPEIYSDAVDVLSNILQSSDIPHSQLMDLIDRTLLETDVPNRVISDQQKASKDGIPWSERDDSEKQLAYALCELINALLGCCASPLYEYLKNSTELSGSNRNTLSKFLNLIVQLLYLEGDVPKFNDIYTALINNVYILLEELGELIDNDGDINDQTGFLMTLQEHILNVVNLKLRHPYAKGDIDVEMDEFLDIRDNMAYVFDTLDLKFCLRWFEVKFRHLIDTNCSEPAEIEVVFYLFSQLPLRNRDNPNDNVRIVPFQQMHALFVNSVNNCHRSFGETYVETYIQLLQVYFQNLSVPDEIDIVISFIQDIIINFKQCISEAASLLCDIYAWRGLGVTSVNTARERHTLGIIEGLCMNNTASRITNNDDSTPNATIRHQDVVEWDDHFLTLYAIVGHMICFCRSNDEMVTINKVFIETLLNRINNSCQKLIHNYQNTQNQIPQQQQPSSSQINPINPENPYEADIGTQLLLVSRFLQPIIQKNVDFPISMLIKEILTLLNSITSIPITSASYYYALSKFMHTTLTHQSILLNTDVPHQLVTVFQSQLHSLFTLVPHSKNKCSCLDNFLCGFTTMFHLLTSAATTTSNANNSALPINAANNTEQLSVSLLIFVSRIITEYYMQFVNLHTQQQQQQLNNSSNNTTSVNANFHDIYMSGFLMRAFKFLHSCLIESGIKRTCEIDPDDVSMDDHTPSITRANLSPLKIQWYARNTNRLRQEINWKHVFAVPAYFIVDYTPAVHNSALRLFISIIKCKQQLPEFVIIALYTNLPLILTSFVKLYTYATIQTTEVTDIVALITAMRENLRPETITTFSQLREIDPVIQVNQWYQIVLGHLIDIVQAAELSSVNLRSQIIQFQKFIQFFSATPPELSRQFIRNRTTEEPNSCVGATGHNNN